MGISAFLPPVWWIWWIRRIWWLWGLWWIWLLWWISSFWWIWLGSLRSYIIIVVDMVRVAQTVSFCNLSIYIRVSNRYMHTSIFSIQIQYSEAECTLLHYHLSVILSSY